MDSILSQMESRVELVIVDGASSDNTPGIMAQYLSRHPEIRYFREQENSGVDRDFDKAVGYASGDYCWLMTDDDLLRPKAIATVLSALDSGSINDLIIVNAEIRNADLSSVLESRKLNFFSGKEYRKEDSESFFAETTSYLSFIGCVVIRRTYWLSKNRTPYFGTLFIHIGVIFQPPSLANVRLIADPLITIRYGNAMWTPRRFEIWMFKWPSLIWSFPEFSDAAKQKVCRREPWRKLKQLLQNRALGSYSVTEFRKFWPSNTGKTLRIVAYLISIAPAKLINFILILKSCLSKKKKPVLLHDLLHSNHTSMPGRLLARIADITKH